MNILILGHGYIGGYLHNHLAFGHACEIHSRSDFDYTNQQILVNHIIENKIDCVINASGYTGRPNVDACEDDKQSCWYNNVAVPKIIEQACMQVDIHRENKPRQTMYIHISSGCIYTGYNKPYTENDEPNFGLYDRSSWYSKTKHAAETILDMNYTSVLRIRMPFSSCLSDRNFIVKMLQYEHLVSHMNSMTCVEDLCEFVSTMIDYKCCFPAARGTSMTGLYNVVHSTPTCAYSIVNLLQASGISKNFKFVDDNKLSMKAPRSNCILSDFKIQSSNMQLPDINKSLEHAVSNVAKKYNQESIW